MHGSLEGSMDESTEFNSGDDAKELRLRDGTELVVRPLRPGDRPMLQSFLARLSQRSRYQRFATAVRELSKEQIQYLTEIDNQNHVAVVAVDRREGKETAVGIARYVRNDQDPELAEVAVTVLDSFQGLGLGTLLLTILAESASLVGVNRFYAFACCDNLPVLKLVREIGAAVRFLGSGMVRINGVVPKTHDWVADSGF
jgi:GNAT superfamily N-acetyltransferase